MPSHESLFKTVVELTINLDGSASYYWEISREVVYESSTTCHDLQRTPTNY